MNTSQLKRFAQEARRKLLEQVAAKLKFVKNNDTSELRGKTHTLNKLKSEINKHGEEAVIDKVAYTWFNRLVALRYMDANGYQPIGMSVVSPATKEQVSPEILSEAHRGNISSELIVDRAEVMNILNGSQPSNNPDNEVYRKLLVSACNHLSNLFPFLFERIDDYTELLLPDDLTSPFSIVKDVYNGMSDEDCKEVEIIGWLYQFYISERKDEVFASKKAVEKEDIPAATQLFTPRWIVEYMVQNTVGKLWLQNRPNSKIKDFMPYYLESPSATSDDYLKLNSVEEIKLLDPACGSGHILVYGFELLYQIYEEEGYSPNEIPELIIKNNLFGLEIDERASQLAGMALMMKARSKSRRFFRKEVKPNIITFRDYEYDSDEVEKIFSIYNILMPDSIFEDLELMTQASNYGSLIQPKTKLSELITIKSQLEKALITDNVFNQTKIIELSTAIDQLIALTQKYHCVVANPPYMGGGSMNNDLSAFVKKNYPDSKSDLMACFMESGLSTLYEKGYLGMINQHSWMFLSSYENLRIKLINSIQFDTLLHLGPRTFPEIGGEVVQNASFTFWNTKSTYKGVYVRLIDFGDSDLKRIKTLEAINNPDCGWFYTANQKNFEKIPGSPIGYWVSKTFINTFNYKCLDDVLTIKQGLATSNNNRFLKIWYEIPFNSFGKNYSSITEAHKSLKKWFPYNKGGGFRKWYGNQEYVISFDQENFEILKNLGNHLPSRQLYFKQSITWGLISSSAFAPRYSPTGFVFDVGGSSGFTEDRLNYKLGLLGSKLSLEYLHLLNPTMNYQVGDIKKIPYVEVESGEIDEITKQCVQISSEDWDSRETSWDFKQNELIRLKSDTLEESFKNYMNYWNEQFFQLHENEEELNRQFIEIYGLQDELTPDVPLEEITILQEETGIEDGELVFYADKVMEQFVSYAVGCMFGRYSLDKEGLILANQGETLQDYLIKVGKSEEELTFVPDKDNIIPVLDEEWFADDIVERLYSFLKASFGEEKFRENLRFVEESLGTDIRRYFIRDFYNDHIKRYKKRPIYWMFSSPKSHFNVLIYMHRYTPDTVSRILNSYLREFIDKLERQRKHLEHIEVSGSAVDQNRARKEIDKIDIMLNDCKEYEKEILYPLATKRVEIDLDDGVLVNYNKMGSAVAKVAGLNDKDTKKKVRKFDWIDTSEIRD